ncbi:MAG: prepilin-type N-terminal cleavage/methylation domain-containing protein [Anaerovoracaceae bacterium]
MEYRKCKPVKKLRGNNRGETLVEVIISFTIFLLILGGIVYIVKSSTSMSTEAKVKSQVIEDGATKVEAGESTKKDSGTMVIEIGGETITTKIDIKSMDPFVYFAPEGG